MRKDPELGRLSKGPNTCQGEEKDSLAGSLRRRLVLGSVRIGSSTWKASKRTWQAVERDPIPGRVKKKALRLVV
jgi:hypothetical protein